MPGVLLTAFSSSGLGKYEYGRSVYRDEHFCCRFAGYDSYPFASFEDRRFFVCLEGRIYDSDFQTTRQELLQIAAGGDPKRWISQTDGDYVALIIEKGTGKACLMNDVFGRLPIYLAVGAHGVAVGRDLRLVSSAHEALQFDRHAVAQYLLLGYPLGRRTLLADVSRLRPACRLDIDAPSTTVRETQLHETSFHRADENACDVEQLAEDLASRFVQACKTRAVDADVNIVSLSGGLDSRAVAAGLNQTGLPFVSVTFLDPWNHATVDVEVAERLTRILGLEWSRLELGPVTGRHALELLKLKQGLNYLGMSYLIPFLGQVRSQSRGRVVFFTGDGGDKTLPDLRPQKHIKTLDGLTRYVLVKNQISPIKRVAALTGFSATEIYNELQRHLGSFPEHDPNGKYVRFLVFERAFKWLFEGEDRNRCFFWSVAPFYSNAFFHRAMACPFDAKEGHKLYRAFLMRLSPQAARVPNASWNQSLTSAVFKLKCRMKPLRAYVPLAVDGAVRALRRKQQIGYSLEHGIVRCLLRQFDACPQIGEWLDLDACRSTFADMTRNECDNLFTITSAAEWLLTGNSTLNEFIDLRLM